MKDESSKKTKTYWMNIYSNNKNLYPGGIIKESLEEAQGEIERIPENVKFIKTISFELEIEE